MNPALDKANKIHEQAQHPQEQYAVSNSRQYLGILSIWDERKIYVSTRQDLAPGSSKSNNIRP